MNTSPTQNTIYNEALQDKEVLTVEQFLWTGVKVNIPFRTHFAKQTGVSLGKNNADLQNALKKWKESK
jgi:hypothetical protein